MGAKNVTVHGFGTVASRFSPDDTISQPRVPQALRPIYSIVLSVVAVGSCPRLPRPGRRIRQHRRGPIGAAATPGIHPVWARVAGRVELAPNGVIPPDVENPAADALGKLSQVHAAWQPDIRNLIDRVAIGRATIRSTVGGCGDFLVVDGVPRNGSPTAKFPANRERNREFFISGPFSRKLPAGTDACSVCYDRIP